MKTSLREEIMNESVALFIAGFMILSWFFGFAVGFLAGKEKTK